MALARLQRGGSTASVLQGTTQTLLAARGESASDMAPLTPTSLLSMMGGSMAPSPQPAAAPERRPRPTATTTLQPPTGDPDMDRLFQSIQERIQQEQLAVENLQRTADALAAESRLFDEADMRVTQLALETRTAKLQALQQNYAEWQNLYQNMIASLEEKIKRKGEVLREVDAQFHTISNESTLCEHFAQSQGQLQTGLAELKHTVRAAMLQKLDVQVGPLGSGGGGGGGGVGMGYYRPLP